MVLCIIVGCSSKSNKKKDEKQQKENIGFFRIPAVIEHKGEEAEELSRERRRRWISAISRDDIESKNVLQNERVCSRHFVSGHPAMDWDKFNVDWAPTLNLGKKNYSHKEDHEAVTARNKRSTDRCRSRLARIEKEVTEKRLKFNDNGTPVSEIDFGENKDTELSCAFGVRESVREQVISTEISTTTCSISEESELHAESTTTKDSGTQTSVVITNNSETQTLNFIELSNAETSAQSFVEMLTCKQDHIPVTSTESQTQSDVETSCSECQTDEFEYMFYSSSYQAPTREYFKDDEKVRFYTGLPSYEVLQTTFEHIQPHVKRRTISLDQFQEFVMVMMKLRLNVPMQDLAYRFMTSVSTVSRIFSSWCKVMDVRLSPLIVWPERDQLWKTMPMCFQYSFGKKVTVVIDCFELFIEKPTNLLARAQTFSSYKHHNTIKVLIGITPQGTISFVSEAWGGRTSDKFLTINCGILEKLVSGDMVMADRGFTISESVALKHAQLVIPAFTKGKSQLNPVDVEKTRGIANVRIHVERVIGVLRNKYTILQGILPTDYLSHGENDPPLIDRIIRICSALVNLSPPIVPFD